MHPAPPFRARRRHRRARIALRVLALAAAVVAFAAWHSRARAAPPAVPSVLRGVWLPATKAGDAACRGYRVLGSDDDARWGWLVGAVSIDAHRVRTLAEYGEGDEIQVARVIATGRAAWRLEGDVTSEGDGPGDARRAVFGLRLDRGVLDWRYTVAGDTARARFRRCAAPV